MASLEAGVVPGAVVPSNHSTPPSCTASGTSSYTINGPGGHITVTPPACAPAPCWSGQHRHGSGSCTSNHSTPPSCTASGTSSYTINGPGGHITVTPPPCEDPEPEEPEDCPTDQHRHGSGSCTSNHSTPPSCTASGTSSYTINGPGGHITVTPPPCEDPEPEEPDQCEADSHNHAYSPGWCHSDDHLTVPQCHVTEQRSYRIHR